MIKKIVFISIDDIEFINLGKDDKLIETERMAYGKPGVPGAGMRVVGFYYEMHFDSDDRYFALIKENEARAKERYEKYEAKNKILTLNK